MRLLVLLGAVTLVSLGCNVASAPAPTPYPTLRPYPTLAPYETPTPYPTLRPYPTLAPYRTPTPYPTLRPYPPDADALPDADSVPNGNSSPDGNPNSNAASYGDSDAEANAAPAVVDQDATRAGRRPDERRLGQPVCDGAV